MKPERSEQLAVKAAVGAAMDAALAGLATQSASSPALVESFRSALQRSRERDEPRQDGSRKQVHGRERAPRDERGKAESPDDREPLATSFLRTDGLVPGPVPHAAPGACGLVTTSTTTPSPDTTSSFPSLLTAQHDALLRQRRAAADTRSCVEVIHSKTGTRFLLSREGNVWLLALTSPPGSNSAELESLAATLNTQFTARGLGPIDILFS